MKFPGISPMKFPVDPDVQRDFLSHVHDQQVFLNDMWARIQSNANHNILDNDSASRRNSLSNNNNKNINDDSNKCINNTHIASSIVNNNNTINNNNSSLNCYGMNERDVMTGHENGKDCLFERAHLPRFDRYHSSFVPLCDSIR